jgi:thioredoxin-like negative regulator of GroEL
MAPTMELLHREYAGKVNFILINGDSREAWPIIDRLGVDAIPHMAMISAEGDVETALIGLVPKYAIEADLNALLENAAAASASASSTSEQQAKKELPAQMLDVFATKPELRRVSFPMEQDDKL